MDKGIVYEENNQRVWLNHFPDITELSPHRLIKVRSIKYMHFPESHPWKSLKILCTFAYSTIVNYFRKPGARGSLNGAGREQDINGAGREQDSCQGAKFKRNNLLRSINLFQSINSITG
ncbi:MAG: hypothetical protein LC649_11315 [Bacteroidales bacterium]|nr:hypothetical protein [Bacteroidales bacterium]